MVVLKDVVAQNGSVLNGVEPDPRLSSRLEIHRSSLDMQSLDQCFSRTPKS